MTPPDPALASPRRRHRPQARLDRALRPPRRVLARRALTRRALTLGPGPRRLAPLPRRRRLVNSGSLALFP